MTEQKPSGESGGKLHLVIPAIFVLVLLFNLLAKSDDESESPTAFRGNAQYSPKQAEMLHRLMREKANDARMQGDWEGAASWSRQCQIDTGLRC